MCCLPLNMHRFWIMEAAISVLYVIYFICMSTGIPQTVLVGTTLTIPIKYNFVDVTILGKSQKNDSHQ